MEQRKNFPSGNVTLSTFERGKLRTLHKRLRENMKSQEVQEKSRCICEKLLHSDWYKHSPVLYAYYPLGNEVDCRILIKQALGEGKTVALPRTREASQMDFFRIRSLEQVGEGAFHVMEPLPNCPTISETNAAVLVPGVVFGKDGSRYGYGKGFYDRYFARFPKLKKIALAYEHQMENRLEILETDIRMDMIYTEKERYQSEQV